MRHFASICLFIILVTVSSCMKHDIPAPTATQTPHETILHGDTLIDPYFWLREKSSPDVVAHLQAENAYTESMTKSLEPFRDKLYAEFLSHIKQTDLSVPYRLGSYHYYTRTEEGLQYPIYCRKKDDSAEEIVLDVNAMAKGKAYFALGEFKVSDDGNRLLYTVDTTGFRQYELFVKNLETGEILPDRVGFVASAVWMADNRSLLYTREDSAKRPHQFFRRQLGSPTEELLFEEKDELFRIDVYRTRDRQFAVLMTSSSESTECHVLPSDRPAGSFKLIRPREFDHEYYVDHRANLFYIRTNQGAKNYRLMTAPQDRPEQWSELIPHRNEVKLDDIDLFKGHLVITELENGLSTFRVMDFQTNAFDTIRFPEPVYSAFAESNPEFDVEVFRFRYQSFITPSSVFEYNLNTHEQKLLKETEVPGGYDRTRYESKRLWATAEDGVRIPISLVMKKGISLDSKNPLHLYGYGSYGYPSSVTFSPVRLSVLDRGVVYAIAHIRGGGEMGESWHDEGKMLKKRNTFTDFIACGDYLVRENYTAHDRMMISGGSAGGLLIGAVLNLRPDLCKVAHLAVPFVDVLNTMLDESLPLTVGEFLEWGNPKKKEEYEYIRSYCPYTNLAKKEYPAILVTTSFHDSQVMYWEPAKYVAKLRNVKTDSNPLLFRIKMEAGHSGASGRYDALKDQAFHYAFLLSQLGIVE